MDIRLELLKAKLEESTEDNFVKRVRSLHQVMFTILNSFVNSKHYDSKDRHVIKLFLESIQDILHQVLRQKKNIKVGFFLTLFETAFGSRAPRDKYDIRLMTRLFGAEILKTLQIETSM